MNRPPYQRIADEIRVRIERGDLKPGDAVPSARQITREWGVALATATKVLATLRQEGLVSAIPGIGTVVATESRTVPVRRSRRTRDVGVVRVATEIADREGLAEVSMRRVASELGVATMSLYRHVPGKDDLVLLMIDAAIGEVELPEPTKDLHTDLEEISRRHWRMFREHPWLASALSVSRPQLVPKGMRMTERILGRLRDAGLSLQDGMYVHIVLFSYVRGIATAIELEAEAVRESGITVDEYMAANQAEFEAIAAGTMPNLTDMSQTDFEFDLDRLFEFGLARLLDGLDLFIADRTGRSRRR
jgi:DNA-binding transcriptional regulator YhcF (GntR family)